MKDLREIAEVNELKYIETTSGSNGYPSNIKGAIIGFDTFEEAEQLADKHSLTVEVFKKKDGWQLWERTNNQTNEPMTKSSKDYGDNYSQFEKISESKFYESEIKDALENFDNLADLQKFLSEKEELFSEIESMEEDEIVITRFGEYYETIKKQSMYWQHDSRHIVIGLIDRN